MRSRSFERRSAVLLAAGSVLLSLFTGCGGGARPKVAVRINEEEISYREFEEYLRASLGQETPPSGAGETRSRLLDQFIGERLLLQRARAEKLSVGDDQVESYLAGLGSSPAKAEANSDDPLREQVRRSLLIQEYKDRVLLKDLEVSPAEIEAYFREHPAEFQQSRVVVLRQILMENSEEAKQVEAELKTDASRFPALAEQKSLSPDKGQPRTLEEAELPDPVKEAVLTLKPGQISEPVADGDKVRVFQMVDKREGKSQSLEEASRRIEVLLLQGKAEALLERTLDEMRKTAVIRVFKENLPFPYQGEYGG
jgi:peptidyl-prolyl cis-trans isomerase C